jgi:ubiquitin-protein ligase
MDSSCSFIRTVSSNKRDDGGEVTDAEGDTRSTSQRSSSGEVVTAASTQEEVPEQKGVLVADEAEEVEPNDEEEDDEDDYEYEDDDDAAFSGFLVDNPAIAAAATLQPEATTAPATIEEETFEQPKPKWRQPSEQAVSMSLRAERESTGGKRRLAQDLYRIMNQDTEVAGFSLQPSSEDCMDKWTIKLFQFDEDSNLAKDMKVLGLENIELEMSFPDQYPFEPPFVRVTRPRFKRQTGFVMNGALCMELLTKVWIFYFAPSMWMLSCLFIISLLLILTFNLFSVVN